MKKYAFSFFCLGCLIFVSPLPAQDFLGGITDNHNGIQQMNVQPASIVSSPWKWDLHPLGVDFTAVNANVFDAIQAAANDNPFPLIENTDEFLVNVDIQLPSFLLRLNERMAIGLELKLRSMVYSETSNSDLLTLLRDNFNTPELLGLDFSNEFLNGRAHVWWEVSGTFAYQLWSNNTHSLNGGISLKYLGGMASGYVNADNLSFVLSDANNLSQVTGNLQFVYNNNLDDLVDEGEFQLFSDPGFGAAFGLEYLWSPDSEGYQLKLGLAVLDLGKIKYNRSVFSGEYIVNFQDINLDGLLEAEDLDAIGEELEGLLEEVVVENDEFIVYMPTKLAIQADYHFGQSIYYLNFSSYLSLRSNIRDINNTAFFSTYILTPRIEKPTWSITVPVLYNKLTGFTGGLGFRFGPVYFGSQNIIGAIARGRGVDRFDLYLGFRFGKRFSLN